jgi:hypothetical protein
MTLYVLRSKVCVTYCFYYLAIMEYGGHARRWRIQICCCTIYSEGVWSSKPAPLWSSVKSVPESGLKELLPRKPFALNPHSC